MRISGINFFNNNAYLKPQKCKTNVSFCNNQTDVFIKSSTNEISIDSFEQYTNALKVNKKRKFDIDDYKSLTSDEIKIIEQRMPKCVQKAVDDNIHVGGLLKKYFDNLYGEDGYIFCSIGTSPSGIARFMEFSGVETKYFPASGLKGPVIFFSKELNKNLNGLNKYLEFLKEQGVTKEQIEKSDKKYIFTDFCHTGQSLNNFEALLKMEAGIPDDDKNTRFLSLTNALIKATREAKIPLGRTLEYNEYYLMAGDIEEYGGIPHLPIKSFEKMDEILSKNTILAPREFNYLMMKELDKKGLLKKNPLNDKSL